MDPAYRFFYRVNFDGSGLTLLTPGNGYHSIELSKQGNYLLDVYSRVDMAPVSVVRDMKGKEILPLEKADLSLLYSTGWREPQKIAVKSADGITDLYGVMYTPFDMDSTRKYPLVVYVYPGPQEDQVPQAFSMDDNGNQALAQLGLIVIHIGYRGGSMFRGKISIISVMVICGIILWPIANLPLSNWPTVMLILTGIGWEYTDIREVG